MKRQGGYDNTSEHHHPCIMTNTIADEEGHSEGEDTTVQDKDTAVVAGDKGERILFGSGRHRQDVSCRHPRTQRGSSP